MTPPPSQAPTADSAQRSPDASSSWMTQWTMSSSTPTMSWFGATAPWDEANLRFANDTIESLFIHYGADRGPDEAPVGGEGRGLTVADHDGEAGDIVDPATASGLRATHYNATITGITRTHETLWIMQVTPDEDLGPYAAGQYTTLGLGYWEPRIDGRRRISPEGQLKKLARRSYSISSSILDDSDRLIDLAAHPSLEFYVVLVEKDWQETPAILTPRLFLKDVGDRLFLGRKVAGRYRLDKVGDPESDVVMLATGTGEAPHNAMTVELLRNGHRGRIVSVCTVRYRRDLAYLDIHRRVEERWDNYRYIPMTTREPENEGAKVYIQDMVTSGMLEEVVGREISPEHTHFFLCGNPAMIGLPEWEGDEPTFPRPPGWPRSSWSGDSPSTGAASPAMSTTRSTGSASGQDADHEREDGGHRREGAEGGRRRRKRWLRSRRSSIRSNRLSMRSNRSSIRSNRSATPSNRSATPVEPAQTTPSNRPAMPTSSAARAPLVATSSIRGCRRGDVSVSRRARDPARPRAESTGMASGFNGRHGRHRARCVGMA